MQPLHINVVEDAQQQLSLRSLDHVISDPEDDVGIIKPPWNEKETASLVRLQSIVRRIVVRLPQLQHTVLTT